MTRRVRLTAVLTHPIQYYTPWFRHLHAHAPEIALTVIYATRPTPEQQGVGFGRAFDWDVPLTDGYHAIVVRDARPGDRIDFGTFSGLDVPEIDAAIAATEPDITLVTGWYSKTLLRAVFASRRLRVPVLFRGDSHLASAPNGWRRPLWYAKTWLLLHLFDAYLSPGTRVDEYLHAFGIGGSRVFRVPHAVDNELFARAADTCRDAASRAAARAAIGVDPAAFVTLFVGKLAAYKRPLDLIRAAARTSQPTTVVVAGSGVLETSVRDEAQRLGVELHVIGFVNQTELGRIYAIADCLAAPGVETWGLAVNEALASGIPVVVSDTAGCAPNLVKAGVTGRCYPFGDVAGLATAIDAVRRELPISDAVRTQCREAVRSHTVEQMTDGLLAACRSIARINRSISRVDVAARFDGRETRDRVDATEQMSSAGLPLGAATTATGKIGRNNDRADHL